MYPFFKMRVYGNNLYLDKFNGIVHCNLSNFA